MLQKSWKPYTLGGLALLFGASLLLTVTVHPDAAAEMRGPAQHRIDGEPLQPLADRLPADPERVALGERLFRDPRLSRSGKVSCFSCHNVDTNGADTTACSRGEGGVKTPLNSPTVFNCALSFRQFWDGRSETLEEQVDGPLTSPAEMNMTWPEVVARLQADPGYRAAFQRAFGGDVRAEHVRTALATYEGTLCTPDGAFDRYLRGEEGAISAAAKRGYTRFKAYGCASCHQGQAIGGNMYARFGALIDYYPKETGRRTDLGRFNVTGRPEHRYQFKVPSLRNVARTAPYFHDGSASNLEDAVRTMARHQLARTLSLTETQELTAFLACLSANPIRSGKVAP